MYVMHIFGLRKVLNPVWGVWQPPWGVLGPSNGLKQLSALILTDYTQTFCGFFIITIVNLTFFQE